MKTNFLFFSLILLFTRVIAQDTNSSAKIEYDMMLYLGNIQNYKAVLLYNNNVSSFTYVNTQKEDIETTDENNNPLTILADTLPKVIYTDRLSKTLYRLQEQPMSVTNQYVTFEPIPNFDWTLYDETKKIGNFVCHKATTIFRGRNYTAWYSLDVKGSYGPWKLQGLPGMILEAYDEKKEVLFSLKKIEIPHIEKIIFDKTKFRNISYEADRKRIIEEFEAIKSELQASQERGTTITVKFTRHEIEIE